MDTLFFVVSKGLAPFLKLETWLFLSVAAGFVFLRLGRVRTATWLTGLGAGLFAMIAILPLGVPILNSLEARYPPNPVLREVAGIILLGGGEDTRRSAAWGQPLVNEAGDRFIAALSLSDRHPEAVVLFTGGIGSLSQSGPSGAAVAERLLTGAGLAPERLILEGGSRNTAENARLSLEHRTDGSGAWLLVTSAFHMPRAVESYCAAGWSDIVPWPTDYRGQPFSDGIGWDLSGHLRDLETAVREIVGLAVYRATGRATDPGGCLMTVD